MTANTARDRRAGGFTLIEILTVLGIMGLLVAAIFVAAGSLPQKAAIEGTRGLFQQISMALKSYYGEFREYPPDGYDRPVFAPNGIQLKGSACLTYFLAWKYPDGRGGIVDHPDGLRKRDYVDSDNIRYVPVNGGEPFWPTVKPREDLNKYGEVVDRFGNPVLYDNCERNKDGILLYTPRIPTMDGTVNPDPRENKLPQGSYNPGIYDLWSCGPDGGKPGAKTDDDIISGREKAK